MIIDTHRILSIQSHVVAGYVGNRAATFPLQTLGYDVDVVNTVHFSNHTGYACVKGQKATAETLNEVFEGLETNGLAEYDKILTGYVPGAEALEVVEKRIQAMKDRNPDIVYILDPVMGDVGRGLYVSPEVVPVYKRMLRMATIITPNQFEVELLSGTTITDLTTLHTALHRLHAENSLPHIAFSSIPLRQQTVQELGLPGPPQSYTSLLPDSLPEAYNAVEWDNPNHEVLVCFASSWTASNGMETWAFGLPTILVPFTGTGDFLSALVAAWYDSEASYNGMSPLASAVSKALLTVQQILLRTHIHALAQADAANSGSASSMENVKGKAQVLRKRELRIIQERSLITDGGEGWPGSRVDWSRLA